MFDDWWIVFVITLIFTGLVSFLIKEPEVNSQKHLESIETKLDSLTKDIENIKKAIED